MSYNIYGVKDVEPFIPSFEERQKNIERILNKELADHEIKVCCFQEVKQNNIKEEGSNHRPIKIWIN